MIQSELKELHVPGIVEEESNLQGKIRAGKCLQGINDRLYSLQKNEGIEKKCNR
jgi:hypothetical protein